MIDIQKLPDDVLYGVLKRRYTETDNNCKFNKFKDKIIKYFETPNLVDIESNIKNYFKSIEDYNNTDKFNIENNNIIENNCCQYEDDEEDEKCICIEDFKNEIKLKKYDIDYKYWERLNLSHIINLDNYDSYNTYIKSLNDFNNLINEFDDILDDIGFYLSNIKEFDKKYYDKDKYYFDLLEILKNYILNYDGTIKFNRPIYINGIDDEIDNKVYSHIQNTSTYCLIIAILTEHYFNIYNKIRNDIIDKSF